MGISKAAKSVKQVYVNGKSVKKAYLNNNQIFEFQKTYTTKGWRYTRYSHACSAKTYYASKGATITYNIQKPTYQTLFNLGYTASKALKDGYKQNEWYILDNWASNSTAGKFTNTYYYSGKTLSTLNSSNSNLTFTSGGHTYYVTHSRYNLILTCKDNLKYSSNSVTLSLGGNSIIYMGLQNGMLCVLNGTFPTSVSGSSGFSFTLYCDWYKFEVDED